MKHEKPFLSIFNPLISGLPGWPNKPAGFYKHFINYPSSNPLLQVLLYIANKNNDDYLGPDTMERMAGSIARCVGHSGPNYEYLFNLAHMTRLLFPAVDDRHLFELEDAVKNVRNGYVGNTK